MRKSISQCFYLRKSIVVYILEHYFLLSASFCHIFSRTIFRNYCYMLDTFAWYLNYRKCFRFHKTRSFVQYCFDFCSNLQSAVVRSPNVIFQFHSNQTPNFNQRLAQLAVQIIYFSKLNWYQMILSFLLLMFPCSIQ